MAPGTAKNGASTTTQWGAWVPKVLSRLRGCALVCCAELATVLASWYRFCIASSATSGETPNGRPQWLVDGRRRLRSGVVPDARRVATAPRSVIVSRMSGLGLARSPWGWVRHWQAGRGWPTLTLRSPHHLRTQPEAKPRARPRWRAAPMHRRAAGKHTAVTTTALVAVGLRPAQHLRWVKQDP
jgi:hypothetical protein